MPLNVRDSGFVELNIDEPSVARLQPKSSTAYRCLTDGDLVAALTNNDTRAFREFVERYQQLLFHHARRMGVPPEECSEWVMELLHDVAMTLVRSGSALRRPIGAYITGASKRKFLHMRRQARYRARIATDAASDIGATSERVVMETSSDYSICASRGPGWECSQLSPTLARFARSLDDTLSPAERQLLQWVASRVTHRQIAAWLGITHGAASQRAWRLCKRMRATAWKLAGEREEAEQKELLRFFRRTMRMPNKSPCADCEQIDGNSPL